MMTMTVMMMMMMMMMIASERVLLLLDAAPGRLHDNAEAVISFGPMILCECVE